MILNEFFNLPQVFEKDMDEGIFGSRPSPVLPVVDKIAKVASGLTPQNVEVGKQIIQNKASEITRMLNPQVKAGVDIIEQGVAEDSTAHDCKHCNGKGYHTVTKKDGTKVATNCPQCKGKGYIVTKGVAEGSEDPFGPQGRFVGDTGPAQITATVRRVPLRTGDRVIYKPTEQRATIEALSRDGTKARIHVPSPMGGRTFNCEVADLKAIGQGSLEEKSTSQAQFRTMAAAAHDPAFARKVGIKQSVAKEFNRADRGQSYKSLPKKA